MLKHWTELVIDLLLYGLWRDYDRRCSPTFPVRALLVGVLLIVLLEPHVLIEVSECSRHFEGVLDSLGPCLRELLLVLPIYEVVFQLLNGEETLQARVHVAVVGIVLQADYPFRELG